MGLPVLIKKPSPTFQGEGNCPSYRAIVRLIKKRFTSKPSLRNRPYSSARWWSLPPRWPHNRNGRCSLCTCHGCDGRTFPIPSLPSMPGTSLRNLHPAGNRVSATPEPNSWDCPRGCNRNRACLPEIPGKKANG